MPNQKIHSLSYDAEKDIAISYYFVDKEKVWIRSPLDKNFIVENPYTGDDRFSSSSYNEVFKIPFLKSVSTTYWDKNAVLVACLWLKDHKAYTDKLVQSNQEFYRCLTSTKEEDDNNWILIPLYTKLHHVNQVRNPVLLYHELNFNKTLIIKDSHIYHQLVDMFGDYVNAFKVVIHGKMKWMIQFAEGGPAYFL